MAKILAVGIATVDIVNTTDGYPPEDAEVRAISQQIRRGGNAANTLVVLSQLGHQCSWIGTIGDDDNALFIKNDLRQHGVDTKYSQQHPGKRTPTSYITLNRNTGSRTIVHYRDLPELGAEPFMRLDLSDFQWMHFEARNIPEMRKMLEYCKNNFPAIPVSIEIEKSRAEIASLFNGIISQRNHYFFSSHFARQNKFDTPQALLEQYRVQLPQSLLICPWGATGAFAMQNERLYYAKAHQPAQVVDTIGAGDVFIAGFIDAYLSNQNTQFALNHACQLAGKKCGVSGLDNILQSSK